MEQTKVRREFTYNKQKLEDPDSSFTPQEVAKYFSMRFPELVNGSIKYKGLKTKDDDEWMEYEISDSIGVKG